MTDIDYGLIVPTHTGQVRINLERAGGTETWGGPEVFFIVDQLPLVSVTIEPDGSPRIDILGTSPNIFDKLPADIQDAAAFWFTALPKLHRVWRAHLADRGLADAA